MSNTTPADIQRLPSPQQVSTALNAQSPVLQQPPTSPGQIPDTDQQPKRKRGRPRKDAQQDQPVKPTPAPTIKTKPADHDVAKREPICPTVDNPKHYSRRKLLFPTPQALQIRVDEYFQICREHTANKYDNKAKAVVTVDTPLLPTLTGLCLHLDIHPSTLDEYGNRGPFARIIARARETCKYELEKRLMDRDCERGAEFMLACNWGWRTHSDQTINVNHSGTITLQAAVSAIATEGASRGLPEPLKMLPESAGETITVVPDKVRKVDESEPTAPDPSTPPDSLPPVA